MNCVSSSRRRRVVRVPIDGDGKSDERDARHRELSFRPTRHHDDEPAHFLGSLGPSLLPLLRAGKAELWFAETRVALRFEIGSSLRSFSARPSDESGPDYSTGVPLPNASMFRPYLGNTLHP